LLAIFALLITLANNFLPVIRALALLEILAIKWKYKLLKGSPLLKALIRQQLNKRQLQSLIKRFATREAKLIRQGHASFFIWRSRRISAVHVYKKRYSDVPQLLKKRCMPKLKSYYINNGVYTWPSTK